MLETAKNHSDKKGLEPEVISCPSKEMVSIVSGILRQTVLAGEKESPIMPLEESLSIHQVMDEIREKWGWSIPWMRSDRQDSGL